MLARWYFGAAVLTLAASAQAQEQWTPPDCAELPANSLEAAILECGDAAAAPSMDELPVDDLLEEAPLAAEVAGITDRDSTSPVVVHRGDMWSSEQLAQQADGRSDDPGGTIERLDPGSYEQLEAARPG